jgi:signal peptidase I
MRPSRSPVPNLVRSAVLVGMAALWVVLAPAEFGGQTSYVMVAGASMEPTLHMGDLVVVRQARTYHVNDIVTYLHPTVGPVIHRIIDRQGNRYVLQGDNNDWIDSYAPTAAEVVGRSWVTLPHGATLLMGLRSPGGLALLSLTFGLILVMTVRAGQSPDTPGAKKKERMTSARQGSPAAQVFEGLAFTLGAVGLGCLLLGLAAFTRPLLEPVPADVPYEHAGSFAYHAPAPASVYTGGQINTGDPIFYHLVPAFDVEFEYSLRTPESASLTGVYQVWLEVSEPNGWRRTVILQPETPFRGTTFSTAVPVDVTLIQRILESLETATGLDRPTFSVDIYPAVSVEGELAGEAFQDVFRPRLSFTLDELELYLRTGDPFTESNDPTRPTQSGFVPRMQETPAELSILGLRIPVLTARWVSAVGLALAAAGLTWVLLPVIRVHRNGGVAALLMRHASLLVEVQKAPVASRARRIEVAHFEDLVKVAEGNAGMILHHVAGRRRHFYVLDGEAAYHFTAPDDGDDEVARA